MASATAASASARLWGVNICEEVVDDCFLSMSSKSSGLLRFFFFLGDCLVLLRLQSSSSFSRRKNGSRLDLISFSASIVLCSGSSDGSLFVFGLSMM